MKGIFNGNVLEELEVKELSSSKEKLIYEVIRIIEKKPLFFHSHIKRLLNSANMMKVNIPFTEHEIKEFILKLVEINQVKEGNIKIVFNSKTSDLGMYFIPHSYPSKEDYENGVRTILYYGERENPNAKIVNNSFREKVDNEIRKNNVYEAILVDNNGYITEGSKSNIFSIKGGVLYTAPVEKVLPGITREFIIQAIKELEYEVVEKRIQVEEFLDMDGMFISGTSPKILPICKVNDKEFNSSTNENIVKLIKKFNEFIESDIRNFI